MIFRNVLGFDQIDACGLAQSNNNSIVLYSVATDTVVFYFSF
jgi:hypothetical protein